MTPVVAFFNSKGGVGTTTLTYHVAWMLRQVGLNVVAVDLDPQASLTSAFVDDEVVEWLWGDDQRRTIYGAIAPLFGGWGDLGDPYVHEMEPGLWLVPGDLLVSETERALSTAWDSGQERALPMLASFASAAQQAASACEADVVLLDVGPNLGAVNRAALVAPTMWWYRCRLTTTRCRGFAAWGRRCAPGAGSGPIASSKPTACGCLKGGCGRLDMWSCSGPCVSTG